MSQASMERVLGKAMTDEKFRLALFANPDETLSGFKLTPSEKDKIRRLDSETLESLAQTLNACPGWSMVIHFHSNTHARQAHE